MLLRRRGEGVEVEVEVEGDVKGHENDIGTYVRLCRSNECMDSFFLHSFGPVSQRVGFSCKQHFPERV